jgi:hypothetical protein
MDKSTVVLLPNFHHLIFPIFRSSKWSSIFLNTPHPKNPLCALNNLWFGWVDCVKYPMS